MQSHAQKAVVERYRPLLDTSGMPLTPEMEKRANEIVDAHCKSSKGPDAFSCMSWNRDVFKAANKTISQHRMIASYKFDPQDKDQMSRAFNFEAYHLLQVASILMVQQEEETGRKTPPEMLADKLVAVMDIAYPLMIKTYRIKQVGVDTGFKR